MEVEEDSRPRPAPRRLAGVTKPTQEPPMEDSLEDLTPRFRKRKKSALSRLTQHMKDADPSKEDDSSSLKESASKLGSSALRDSNIFDIDDLLPDGNVGEQKPIKTDRTSVVKSVISEGLEDITGGSEEVSERTLDTPPVVLSDAESDADTPRTRKKKSSLSKLLAKKKVGSQESIKDIMEVERSSLSTETPIPEVDEVVNYKNVKEPVLRSTPARNKVFPIGEPLKPDTDISLFNRHNPGNKLSKGIDNQLLDVTTGVSKTVTDNKPSYNEARNIVNDLTDDENVSQLDHKVKTLTTDVTPSVAATTVPKEKLPLSFSTPHPPSMSKMEKQVSSFRHKYKEPVSDYESGSNEGSRASLVGEKLTTINTNNSGNGNKCASKQPNDDEGSDEDSQSSLNNTQMELTKNYKNILRSSEHSPGQSDVESDSVLSSKVRLTPVKPSGALPTMDKNIMSESLKTSYKQDWARVYNALKGTTPSPPTLTRSDGGASELFSPEPNTSLLRSIRTSQARKRNFLVGSTGSKTSLMGSDELNKYFPDRILRLMVGTFNLAEQKDIPQNLEDFLLPESMEFLPDMYVIGVQEMLVVRHQWEVTLQETLGLSHVLFHSAIHGSLHIAVFLKRDLIWFCSVPEVCTVTTRVFKMIKTKGAVGICFTLFGTSFLFLGSHFRHGASAAQSNDRVEDYKQTIQSINLPKQVVQNPHEAVKDDATDRFDCVFWCGDFNFRIQRDREQVLRVIKEEGQKEHPHFEDLVRSDELLQFKDEGLIFNHFQEGRINFPPTYKYDIGTDDYDSSEKQRIPSYTDRVLFRSKKKNHIVCTEYNCAQTVMDSDHKPVYAMFDVTLKPGKDTIPLASGQFNKSVFSDANERRALKRAVDMVKPNRSLPKRSESKVCVIQ